MSAQPSRVEFRLLQASLGPIGGDRMTLALVHWDGRTLRHAERSRLPGELEPLRAAARRALRATQRVLDAVPDPALDLGLDALFPVRSGDAVGLSWTPVQVGHTRDPERHFDELVQALRLASVEARRVAEITSAQIAQQLAAVGVALRDEPAIAGRVAVHEIVSAFDRYDSPLSWRVDGWRHSMALAVMSADRANVVAEVRRVTAVLDLAIPRDASLVVVFPEPADATIREELAKGLDWLHADAGDRLDRIALPVIDAQVDTAPVAQLVRSQLLH